jgi:hypothetical protein
MSDFERKKKMISLRLSDAEYASLKSQYQTYGARNVSDLARLALQRVIGHPLAAASASFKIHELDERVAALEEKIASLLNREKEMA